MSQAALLERRLAAIRAARVPVVAPRAAGASLAGREAGAARAERLAAAVGGEWLSGPGGHVVRVEPAAIPLPLLRARLASLPGQPPALARLVCLDTETTGLGTAAGTLAFLVGLGWWEGDRFRQLQLLCPDHADEAALLAAVEAAIPPDAWLVTYNGRAFDWPLLVTRYRMLRRAAPAHAGMLDLLPHVRRLFRHRLGDARLATVERHLLGVRRDGDVGGAEIPERYLAFIRGGSAAPLAPVVAHNAEDVRSLGRLLVHLDREYADPARRRLAPAGDLVALARGYTRERRHAAALACLEEADAGWHAPAPRPGAWPPGIAAAGAPSPASGSGPSGPALSDASAAPARLPPPGRRSPSPAGPAPPGPGSRSRRCASTRSTMTTGRSPQRRRQRSPRSARGSWGVSDPSLRDALAQRRRRLAARLGRARGRPPATDVPVARR